MENINDKLGALYMDVYELDNYRIKKPDEHDKSALIKRDEVLALIRKHMNTDGKYTEQEKRYDSEWGYRALV